MTIEIVDFPIKKGGSFHSFLQHSVTVYQRVPVFPGESRNGKLGANSLIPMVQGQWNRGSVCSVHVHFPGLMLHKKQSQNLSMYIQVIFMIYIQYTYMKSYHRSILSCSLHAKLSGHPFRSSESIAIEQRFRHLQGEGIPAIDHEIAKLQCLSEQREMVRESWKILESIHFRMIISAG